MQHEEARPRSGRTFVVQVEPLDAVVERRSELVVAGHVLLVRVRPVGQQREVEMAFGIGEVVHLESFELLLEVGAIREQCGHRDQGAKLRRHALGQLELGQPAGAGAAPAPGDGRGPPRSPRRAPGRRSPAARAARAPLRPSPRRAASPQSWSAVSAAIAAQVSRDRVATEARRSRRRSWKRKPSRRSKSLRPRRRGSSPGPPRRAREHREASARSAGSRSPRRAAHGGSAPQRSGPAARPPAPPRSPSAPSRARASRSAGGTRRASRNPWRRTRERRAAPRPPGSRSRRTRASRWRTSSACC